MECFKYSLVAWEKVCSPLEMSGLGIRKLVHFNQALLVKQLWRIGQEGTHLWRRVVATKYGEGQGGWNTKVCRRAHGCSLWRGINESWERFSKHLALVMSDGSRILFWHDGLGIPHLECSILSYMHVQTTRKLAIFMYYIIRRVKMIEFGI